MNVPVDARNQREVAEEDIRAMAGRGAVDDAATLAIRTYGGEVFGYLMAIHGSKDDASDVFSIFAERLWKNLPGFNWQSTLRTWSYVIARNASHSYRRDKGRRRAHEVVLTQDSQILRAAAKVRTTTLAHLRTETKSEVQKLRDTLSPDDRTLLILRVDRDLEWNEIARVFLDASEDLPQDDAELKREAARLRKRFQLVKEKLVKLGKERGLIKPSS
jgi:RNA polymerase sigma-70 factor (ECF subfamily)